MVITLTRRILLGYGFIISFKGTGGVQYTSRSYQKLLANKGICSMNGTGNCFDNAVAESFFHSLKIELVYHQHYKTREEAKQSIFEYMDVFW